MATNSRSSGGSAGVLTGNSRSFFTAFAVLIVVGIIAGYLIAGYSSADAKYAKLMQQINENSLNNPNAEQANAQLIEDFYKQNPTFKQSPFLEEEAPIFSLNRSEAASDYAQRIYCSEQECRTKEEQKCQNVVKKAGSTGQELDRLENKYFSPSFDSTDGNEDIKVKCPPDSQNCKDDREESCNDLYNDFKTSNGECNAINYGGTYSQCLQQANQQIAAQCLGKTSYVYPVFDKLLALINPNPSYNTDFGIGRSLTPRSTTIVRTVQPTPGSTRVPVQYDGNTGYVGSVYACDSDGKNCKLNCEAVAPNGQQIGGITAQMCAEQKDKANPNSAASECAKNGSLYSQCVGRVQNTAQGQRDLRRYVSLLGASKDLNRRADDCIFKRDQIIDATCGGFDPNKVSARCGGGRTPSPTPVRNTRGR